MTQRPTGDRSETAFTDYKLPLARDQAVVEANRCLFCADAPCIQACPTAIDIPQFIRKISTGNDKGSARTIFEANILGMSCARVCPVEVLCVGACVYNHLDAPPIQIGKLQRYATDRAFDEGWRFFEAGPDTGKSVGLIGGGPASLAAAHELRRFGHRCTIYEKRDTLGGLNTTGVAPYKMRADRAVQEVEWIMGIGGIDVKTGVAVGEGGGVSLDELENRHDAVFVGVGLGADSALRVPGEDLPGVLRRCRVDRADEARARRGRRRQAVRGHRRRQHRDRRGPRSEGARRPRRRHGLPRRRIWDVRIRARVARRQSRRWCGRSGGRNRLPSTGEVTDT